MLTAFEAEASVEAALMAFVRQAEQSYEPAHDITLFVFALRSFLCWHRAPELLQEPATMQRVHSTWIQQNEESYTRWLVSANDDPEALKWAKWTFQAKTSILKEWANGLTASGGT